MRVKAALIRTLLMLLGAAVSVSGQATTDWKNGIVKIETNDSALAPGTGFVVALGADHVFIVTAAHVVRGDGNPTITFALDPYNSFVGTVTVIHIEGGEERGLALIRASGDLPEQLVALAPTESLLSKLDSRYGNLDSMQAESPWSVSRRWTPKPVKQAFWGSRSLTEGGLRRAA